jgi:hypothetical protein
METLFSLFFTFCIVGLPIVYVFAKVREAHGKSEVWKEVWEYERRRNKKP